MKPTLELRHVSKTHTSPAGDVHALREVDLALYPGELVAVMGPSGSGKSTLLNMAGGLDAPTSGDVLVGGTSIVGLPQREMAALRRTRVGFVFQDLNLVPALTAAENAALPLELDGLSTRDARKAGIAALASVGLEDLADRYPEEISGGQQQRVAIARSLVGDRSLVLADEPTGALDSVTGEEVLMVLRDRCDAGAAVLLVTHDSRHASWADRIVNLRDGAVVDVVGDLPEGAETSEQVTS
ncbi:ABC transporter ATP-binding protein [Dermacoccus barathri]|uniref:ABC transporter ATP-binding protein n=1 Tax=Dermacoccus barathri TaxID=322601 RepID=UPI001879BEF0|nr:ABC transporter ATP-binding protein [Dermacoccus barathri]MBE7371655.1 ABC transporter ATP-binding protein [Dermacoccus barathri]